MDEAQDLVVRGLLCGGVDEDEALGGGGGTDLDDDIVRLIVTHEATRLNVEDLRAKLLGLRRWKGEERDCEKYGAK